MDKTLQIQTQIRQNAEEISTALSGMGKWEKEMKNRDGNIKAAHQKAVRVPRVPIRSGVGTVPVQDKENSAGSRAQTEPKKATPAAPASSLWQTPSSIVASKAPPRNAPETIAAVPAARGTYEARDLEESERERGNAEFKGGNFTAAVKSYTKCLGLKGRNYVAFSNRAMAYLKLKEYARAVSDCTCALLIEPHHVKSLLRRSTAYNAVGKHRAALRDLLAAQDIEPANKQVRQDLLNTKELLRNAVSRAPLVTLHPLDASLSGMSDTAVSDARGDDEEVKVVLQGPDVRPPNFTTVVVEEVEEVVAEKTVSTASSTTRVTIVDEDEDETPATGASTAIAPATGAASSSATAANAVTGTFSSATTTTRVAITIDDDSDAEGSPATHATNTTNTNAAITTPTKTATEPTSTTKKTKKVKTPTTPVPSTLPITSCYELERELEIASRDSALIARVFDRVKRTEIKSILSNLLEPTVLYRLLNAVYLHFGTRRALIVVKWYTTVANTKKFTIQYGLLDEDYKVTLRAHLASIAEYVGVNEVEGLSVEKVVEVQALYLSML